jgi:hypothetical protein
MQAMTGLHALYFWKRAWKHKRKQVSIWCNLQLGGDIEFQLDQCTALEAGLEHVV